MRATTFLAIFGLGVITFGCAASIQEEPAQVDVKKISSSDEKITSRSVEITMENGEIHAVVDGRELSPEEARELVGSGAFVMSNTKTPDQESSRPRAMLGIRIEPTERGILVNEAIKGTPAAKAGLRKGDVIIKVNGKDATSDTLNQVVGRSEPGKTLNLVVARGDQQKKMKVKLVRWNEKRMNPEGEARDEDRHAESLDESDVEWNTESRIMIVSANEGLDKFIVNPDEDQIRTEVFIELDGDEDFDEEMIKEMIRKQLMSQDGEHLDERMIGNIMEMAMGQIHQRMDRHREGDEDEEEHENRWRDDDRGHDSDDRGLRNVMNQVQQRMDHMRRGMEEELNHVFNDMNERFNEGGKMFEEVVQKMHENFQDAGNGIRENFEQFGDAMRRMHEERERIVRQLEESQQRQRELSERVSRLEQMIERMTQGQRPEREEREKSQRSKRRRGENNSPDDR